ncbi:hypothetical protein C8J57DRAFT_1402502 [Mycena rebaudengoi]|nr:hypothetical protein C8J57DRAFT_1402502 [Mycena rebaudengoi]
MMHLQAYIVRALFSLFSESHCSPGYRTRSSCPHLFYISFRSAVPSTLILLISSFSRCRSLVQTSRDARTLSLRISTNLSCGAWQLPKEVIGRTFDRMDTVRCSNWCHTSLSDDQKQHAVQNVGLRCTFSRR